MSALIATPMRGRSADFAYVVGILQSNGAFDAFMPCSGQSDIYLARNTLANQFLKLPYDSLVFIDSDIGFTRQDYLDLVATPEPYVSGLYPEKGSEIQWVFRDQDGKIMPCEKVPKTGLLKAKHIPCGFLKIDRRVFEALIDQKIVDPYGTSYQFFKGVIEDGHLLSEDYSFSSLVRQAGFQPYVNCGIRLEHDGRRIQA